ncbi:MAG: phosphatase PAP2 family protein [Rhodanobacter sp.]|nr:MAG: phosphatase PAP2 family protein [Rhodanobacter sp.]TAM02009.1 MAG: phosphatase PAP2 family protein [Rhodanobacter sp.]TAM41007.1 MAG: phosphatase PAP2 family protein [Rhodanobacter sp.]
MVLACPVLWARHRCAGVAYRALPRPPRKRGLSIGAPVGGRVLPLPVNSEGSFPSGHAAFAAVLVRRLWRHFSGCTARAMLVPFLVCVGLSRVLIGAHFPADVVAAYIAGLASVRISNRLLRRVERAWTERVTNGREGPEGRARR